MSTQYLRPDAAPAGDLEDLEGPDLEGTPAAGTPLRELATPAAASSTDERYIPGHLVHVQLEDGSEWTTRIDNRDYLRFDKNSAALKIDGKRQPFLLQSFLAYAASVREGHTSLSWAQFQTVCTETVDVKSADLGAEDEDAARPTR